MRHTSTLMLNSPIEFIESTQISPFISKVLIKVCYVGDEPNRNGSVISKETAREMGPTLRGCPIVGFYNDKLEDFEEHNRRIDISNGEWHITDTTTPYGFVPTDAKVWFATYLDDSTVEREYLCTEGYLWDHTYPEAGRVLTKGNNQSMELDNNTLKGTWSEPENDGPSFFIINEALISKLCILGEDIEPCFEGSQITAFSLKIDDSFQTKMQAMMREMQILLKGGTAVKGHAVKVGDNLWSALYSYIENTYPDTERVGYSKYAIDGVYAENGQKFAVLRDETKYWRLNFSLDDAGSFQVTGDLTEVESTSGCQFAAEEVDAFIADYAQQKTAKTDEDKKEQEDNNNPQEKTEGTEKSSEENEKKKKEKKFSYDNLEEIPEYCELLTRYAALQEQITSFTNELTQLREYKVTSERAAKQAKIAEFYMLSDEDKADVLTNIDTYSLDDIEAKLSVICFRKKINFSQSATHDGPTTFNLTGNTFDDNTPAWVKACMATQNKQEN